MKLLTVLAATAVATAVAAAITIPAGAGERAAADAGFVACLRSEGLDIPATTRGAEIKQWAARQPENPAVERAFAACKPKGESPEKLVECLRGQGLEPPAAIEQLKPWIGRQLETGADKEALRACGMDAPPKGKAGVTLADRETVACGARKAPEDEAADEQ